VILACVVLVIGYLVGSISFSNMVAMHFAHTNLLKFGSKNAGASNVGQLLGMKAMVIVGCVDVSKCALSVGILRYVGVSTNYLVLLGCAVIAGHCWSCLLNFKGGRGVASLTGAILGLGWLDVFCASMSIAAVGVVIGNRPVFVALAVLALPFTALIFDKDPLSLASLGAIVFVKRILGNTLIPESSDGLFRGYLRRLVFDRDIVSNVGWIRRGD